METNILAPDVAGEILPRRTATSEELKLLGQLLTGWSEEELRAGGLLRAIDNIVLTELMGGDDPSGVLFAVVSGDDPNDWVAISRLTPPHSDPAEAAGRLVVCCTFRGPAYD